MMTLAVKLGVRLGVIVAEVMGDRPEIIGHAVAFRRDAMTDDELPALLAGAAFRRTGAGFG